MADKIDNPVDDVRNDVAAAISQLKGDAPAEPVAVEAEHPEPELPLEAAPAPVADKAEHPSDPNRYADGTFKPTKAEAAPKEAAPAAQVSPPVDNTAKANAQPSTAVGTPPVSWAAEAKANWAALSPAIQNAVLKREAEVSNGFRQKSEEVRRYEAAITPIAQEASRLGISVEQGISALMSAHARISQDPHGFIVDLARQAGIDLAELATNPPAPQAQMGMDPRFVQTLSAVQSQVDELLTAQTAGLLNQFARTHPHYERVKSKMGMIYPQLAGTMSDDEALQQAYDQAVWLEPDIREQLIAERAASSQQAKIASVQTKQAQASRAAVSVKGSSNGASPPAKAGNTGGDVYDDVRAAITQLRA